MTHGFCFANAYLAMKYFTKQDIAHDEFKGAAAVALTSFKISASLNKARSIKVSWDSVLHTLKKWVF